ncbi:hypothetical protein [Metabacillus sp. Hm71]
MTKEDVKEVIKEMFKDGTIEIKVRCEGNDWVYLDVSVEGENVISVSG